MKSSEKTAFGDTNTFATKGGLAGMSSAAAAGMVLVMSIWVIPCSSFVYISH
jgi:cellulose 1,4-beta-cellobiosidase